MDAIIKSLETTLSEQTAMMRILQSNQSAAAVSNAQHLIFGASQQQQQQQQHQQQHQQQQHPEFDIPDSRNLIPTRTLTPTQQQQHQQQQHARQLSHLGVSPGVSPALFSHGKQLSTPAAATSTAASTTSSDLLRSLALSPMLRTPMSHSPQMQAASTAELLHRPQPTRLSSQQLLMGSTPPPMHFPGEGIHISRNLGGVQLTPKELLRSATPTADAFSRRSVTPVGLVERLAASAAAGPQGGRRDSAPGGVVLGGSAAAMAAAAIKTNTSTGAT